MGCDIHMFVEKRVKNSWVNCDHYKKQGDGYQRVKLYGTRNYTVFGHLAKVRKEGNKYTPDPKGIPHDTCPLIRSEFESWGSDAHSASHFTLEELRELREVSKVSKYSGMMTPENANLVDEGKMPEMWCGWTNQEHYERS